MPPSLSGGTPDATSFQTGSSQRQKQAVFHRATPAPDLVCARCDLFLESVPGIGVILRINFRNDVVRPARPTPVRVLWPGCDASGRSGDRRSDPEKSLFPQARARPASFLRISQ